MRDNLGESTPPIYLCGLLDKLSDAKKQILRQKNILTVDVSPLFLRTDWADSTRHAKATEWILINLMNGKPPELRNWPESLNSNAWPISDGLPPLISTPSSLPQTHRPSSQVYLLGNREVSESLLLQVLEEWRQMRLTYPGWVVCPSKNRESLWQQTEEWVDPIFNSIKNLEMPDSLFLLYELNWRLETTLTPLLSRWVEKLLLELSKYNPYPKTLDIPESTINPCLNEYRDLEWRKIKKYWVSLSFAIIRAFRENHNEEEYQLWINRIQKVIDLNIDWHSKWVHEKCLFHLSRFEHGLVRQTLTSWPLQLGFWEVKRASILASLNEVKEAKSITERALENLRSHIQPYSDNYELLSQEAWTMYLLYIIDCSQLYPVRRDQFRDLWLQLESYRCNPRTELEKIDEKINNLPPRSKPSKEQVEGFYPGTVLTNYHSSNLSIWINRHSGFQAIRILEEGGLPLQCGRPINSNRIMNLAKWILPFSPLWSLTLVIQTNDISKIKMLLKFIYIATLEQADIEYLFKLLIAPIHKNFQSNVNNKYELRHLDAYVFGLSRICFRLKNKEKLELLEAAIRIYKACLRKYEYYYELSNSVNSLFESIFYAFSDIEILEVIPTLLSIPLPEYLDDISSLRLQEPFWYITSSDKIDVADTYDRFAGYQSVQTLINKVRDGGLEARKCAILRLNFMHINNALTEEEQASFAMALWSKVDSQTSLPSEIPLKKFAVLTLPEVEEGSARKNLKKYLKSINIAKIYPGEMGPRIQEYDYSFFEDLLRGSNSVLFHNEKRKENLISWSPQEVKLLFKTIYQWWKEEKEAISRNKSISIFEKNIDRCMDLILDILGQIILPNIEESDELKVEEIFNFISEIEDIGFCVLSILPMTLFLKPNDIDMVSHKLRHGLTSIDGNIINNSVNGLFDWLVCSVQNLIPRPVPDLLDDLINRVLYRIQPGLDASIHTISSLIYRVPESITAKQIDLLCISLNYLLADTELPTLEELEMLSETSFRISFSDRPFYRELSSRLAYHLYNLFLDQNKKIPDVLTQWKDISKTDVLPRVRNIWL